MRRPRPDAGDRLARALHVGLSALGAQTAIEERTSRDWASITFSGARHCLRLRLEGYEACTAADALLARLEQGMARRREEPVPQIPESVPASLAPAVRQPSMPEPADDRLQSAIEKLQRLAARRD